VGDEGLRSRPTRRSTHASPSGPKNAEVSRRRESAVATRATVLATGVSGPKPEDKTVVANVTGLAAKESRGGGKS